jgi:hypothetical protein
VIVLSMLYAFLMMFLRNEEIILGHLSMAMFVGVMSCFTVATLLLLDTLITDIPKRFKRRQLTKDFPTGVITDNLLDILYWVERKDTDWGSSKTAQIILPHLEKIAVALQSLADQMRIGDLATDFWYRQAMNQKADSVRNLKKWVLTPQPQTRTDFQKRISETLIQLLERNWDAFLAPEKPKEDQVDEEDKKAAQSEWRRSFGFRLWRTTRQIIAAFLPLIIVLVWLRYLPPITEPLASYITIFTIVWAVLAILHIIDPTAATEILEPVSKFVGAGLDRTKASKKSADQ